MAKCIVTNKAQIQGNSGWGSRSAHFSREPVSSVLILQRNAMPPTHRRARHNQLNSTEEQGRETCSTHGIRLTTISRRNSENPPQKEKESQSEEPPNGAQVWCLAFAFLRTRTRNQSPDVLHGNIYTAHAVAGHPTAHASSANDRPTLGFFFALTFDEDDALRTRTRGVELWSASSSSLRPSPTTTAFRLATDVVGLDE